jgi:hypothetical protein
LNHNNNNNITLFNPIDAELMTDSLLEERQIFLKQILINFTKKQHDSFLKKNKIKFDAVKNFTWHSSFDLDNVKEIKKKIILGMSSSKKRW